MKKWNKRTAGGLQWPIEGTFDRSRCDEAYTNIKHHKASNNSDRRVGKRYREKEVLSWFVKEGDEYAQSIKELKNIMRIKKFRVTRLIHCHTLVAATHLK